nr:hypothetical protein [Rubrobacter marinus]
MGRRLARLAVLLAFLLIGPWAGASRAQGEGPEVFVARVEGSIDGRTAAYVSRVVAEAEEAGAAAVVLELDTPGGSLDATQRIVRAESNAEGVPVVTYVTPRGARAASAGTFVAMGSDVAAMAPQTRLGAAHPVLATGAEIEGPLGEKVTNDAAALMVGLADAHGRDEAWAESAVRESAAVDAAEALELGVVEHVEEDLRAVLDEADGTRVEPKGLTLRTRGRRSCSSRRPSGADRDPARPPVGPGGALGARRGARGPRVLADGAREGHDGGGGHDRGGRHRPPNGGRGDGRPRLRPRRALARGAGESRARPHKHRHQGRGRRPPGGGGRGAPRRGVRPRRSSLRGKWTRGSQAARVDPYTEVDGAEEAGCG